MQNDSYYEGIPLRHGEPTIIELPVIRARITTKLPQEEERYPSRPDYHPVPVRFGGLVRHFWNRLLEALSRGE